VQISFSETKGNVNIVGGYVTFFVTIQITLGWFTFNALKQKSRVNLVIYAASNFPVIPLVQNSNSLLSDLKKIVVYKVIIYSFIHCTLLAGL